MRIIKLLIIGFLTVLSLVSCSHGEGAPDPARSVYFWRTTLSLDSTERQFLAEHGVKKVYVRFFDVVVAADGSLQPNATLKFQDTFPDSMEVIPTVFISENCLEKESKQLPELLVKRVLQMCETNDVKNVHEMQLDFDWTATNQDIYFDLLEQVRTLLKKKNMRLSVTIRLHQLAMTPPPADYGVLMMYNTGDATKRDTENPILDYKDAMPYLKNLDNYALPLCVAYPNFGWKLLFRDDEFKAILYDTDLNDTTLYRRQQDNSYLAVSSRELMQGTSEDMMSTHINPGDEVIVHEVSFDVLKLVHDKLGEQRSSINSQVIFYDLNSENINRYKHDEYETIYHP